jgi:hypothetical protein
VFSNTNQNSSFQVQTDLHFPENMFDLEDMIGVDDLLNDLGIMPQIESDRYVPIGEENGPTTTIFHAPTPDRSPEHYRPVSPSESLKEQPSTTASLSPHIGNAFVRSVSLDQVANPSSVPNPLANQYITPKTSSQRTAAVSPDRHKSQGQGQKRKYSDDLAEKDFTVEEMEDRRYVTTTCFRMRCQNTHAATVISHFLFIVFPCNRERNRSHAKKSRQRKKVLTVLLQESVEELKSENKKLREEVNAFIGQKKVEAIMKQKRERNRDQFLTALMDPRNRVLDTNGMAFMKKIRKSVPRDW